MRCVLAAITVIGLCAAGADAAMVRFQILTGDGETEGRIGPEGGRIPYQIIVETDPLGTPDNFGLASVSFTLTTNTGVPQLPATGFGPDFESWGRHSFGEPVNDDVLGIWASQIMPRPRGRIPYSGVAQSGFVPFAAGELVIPPAPVGTVFLIRGTNLFLPIPTVALVFTGVGGLVDVAETFDQVMPVFVVPEPTSLLLLAVGCGAVLRQRQRTRTRP